MARTPGRGQGRARALGKTPKPAPTRRWTASWRKWLLTSRAAKAKRTPAGPGGLGPSAGSSWAFWTLAVVALANLPYLYLRGLPMVKVAGFAVAAACCVVVLAGALRARALAPGRPAVLLLAAVAAYAVLGALSYAGLELPRLLLRPAFYFGLLLAAVLGSRILIRNRGVDFLLKGVLAALAASCAIVVATPVLRHWWVVWPPRLLFRMSGAFGDPNEAGFVGCVAVVVALALLQSPRHRSFALWGATLGVLAALASLSTTACVVLAATWLYHLGSSGLRPWRIAVRWVPVAAALALFVHAVRDVKNTKSYIEYDVSPGPAMYCGEVPASNPGLRRDCTILQETAGALTGRAAADRVNLDWTDSRPLAHWRGVRIAGEPPRVVSLDLSDMGLNGRIPAELADLDGLSALRLQGNRLSGPIPPQLGALARLRLLDLSGNALTGRVPVELGSLSQLSTLLLSHNRLSGPGPWTLENFEMLSRVQMDGNDWSSSSPFPDAPRLGPLARRARFWRIGAQRFLESPFVGNGIGSMFSLSGAPTDPTGTPSSVHNTYLKLAGEAGIVPVLLYVLFLASLLRTHWALARCPARAAATGGGLAMVLYSMAFDHLLQVGAYVFTAGVLAALAASGEPSASSAATADRSPPGPPRSAPGPAGSARS